MKQAIIRIYGIFCYLAFLFTFLYLICFIENLPVPKAIDSGRQVHAAIAIFIDMVLLSLFAVQHTVMARRAFKRWWLKIIPWRMERSTFVLITSLIFLLIFWGWRPVAHPVWDLSASPLNLPLRLFSWVGWGIVLLSTFNIDHFDLFGLRQSFAAKGKRVFLPSELVATGLYRFVRHPLLLGFLIAFWSAPRMSAGHFLFAAFNTVYIFIGIQFEERDLLRRHKGSYAAYRRKIPMILPLFGRQREHPSD